MIRRFIPQWLACLVCGLFRHPARRFTAWDSGVQAVIYVCRCGKRMDGKIYPANRKIRRAAAKARRRG